MCWLTLWVGGWGLTLWVTSFSFFRGSNPSEAIIFFCYTCISKPDGSFIVISASFCMKIPPKESAIHTILCYSLNLALSIRSPVCHEKIYMSHRISDSGIIILPSGWFGQNTVSLYLRVVFQRLLLVDLIISITRSARDVGESVGMFVCVLLIAVGCSMGWRTTVVVLRCFSTPWNRPATTFVE